MPANSEMTDAMFSSHLPVFSTDYVVRFYKTILMWLLSKI